MIRTFCWLALCLSLAGCVAATPYQKLDSSGGYGDTKLQEDVFKVEFKGNSQTSAERADDLALLRAAELTLEKGFSHFVVLTDKSRPKTDAPAGTGTVVIGGGGFFYAPRYYFSDQASAEPVSSLTIKCFRGAPRDNPPLGLLEAGQVRANLRRKYGLD